MASRTPGRPAITQRQRLGTRLKVLRELAGLRNEDLAEALNLSPATVSRMESGDRVITLTEIATWVRKTGAPAATRDELASLAEAARTQIRSWQSRLQHGVDQAQQETTELEASAGTILGYDHAVVHGLLQVREYARLVFEMTDVGTGDIAGKVEGRLRRQGVLLDQSKQFSILMTEAALRWRPGSVELQVQQLQRIAAVMRLPNVAIGILPLGGQARALYPEGFQLYADRADGADTLVVVELVPDEVAISEPDSVALYLREFDRLRSVAISGEQARALLDRVAEDMRRGDT
jgi:transcriptional regulator with XRE-family HTH domain